MKRLALAFAVLFFASSSFAQEPFSLVAAQRNYWYTATQETATTEQPATEQPVELIEARDKFSTPKVTITGAEQAIPVGGLVQLGVTLESKPKDLHSVSYTWTVLPKTPTITWPDGTKIIFGTGVQNSTFTVILTASFVYTTKEGDKITEIIQRSTTSTVSVQIQGSIPTPGPGPGPGPGPRPDSNLTGLSKQAYDWVGLVNRTGSYTDDKVKSDAQKLSVSFNGVAAAVAAGVHTDVQAILKATKESNDATIENRTEWLPWFTKMSEYLQQSYGNGTVRTPQQFAAAWREIAKGLEAASR